MSIKNIFKANAYTSISKDEVKYFDMALFYINDRGVIEKIIQKSDSNYETELKSVQELDIFRNIDANKVILPGFIDLHIHAPQWAQAGTALDKPLEVWLNEYTFPLEAKFTDLEFSNKVYTSVVNTTLKNGTTTALYFATVDLNSSYLLAKICAESGQRGLVGKVVMDDTEQNLDFYRDANTQTAISESEEFIKKVNELSKDYIQGVYPVITPRFIPSCTDEALSELGKLAKKYNTHIQSHCSESDWEHRFVKNRFKISDTFAHDKFGLLTDKTILAHAPHLSDDDVDCLVKKDSSVAHCPISNAFFANAVLPVKHFQDLGLNIALGTDISGGFSPSMYHAIRQSLMSSQMLQDGVDSSLQPEQRGRKNSRISLNNAFYIATQGGAKAIKLDTGNLAEGYAWDVQIIDTNFGIPKFYTEKSQEDLLHKILLLSESSNIVELWVQGRQIRGIV